MIRGVTPICIRYLCEIWLKSNQYLLRYSVQRTDGRTERDKKIGNLTGNIKTTVAMATKIAYSLSLVVNIQGCHKFSIKPQVRATLFMSPK